MIDLINDWKTLMAFVSFFTAIGSFIYMVKEYGKRIKILEDWKNTVVDGKLNSIESKLDVFIAEQKGAQKLTDEKYNNILEKINELKK